MMKTVRVFLCCLARLHLNLRVDGHSTSWTLRKTPVCTGLVYYALKGGTTFNHRHEPRYYQCGSEAMQGRLHRFECGPRCLLSCSPLIPEFRCLVSSCSLYSWDSRSISTRYHVERALTHILKATREFFADRRSWSRRCVSIDGHQQHAYRRRRNLGCVSFS